MPRAVVTGGAGFLGSHLCDRLLSEDWDVVCLDTFLTSGPANLAHSLQHDRFSSLVHDVTTPIAVKGPVDWVLHLASPASPRDYLDHGIHTLKIGALGTLNSLGLAKAKEAGFLLASTSEVYGDPRVHPQPETYWGNVNPVGPRSVYDEAKRYAEALAVAYERTHGMDIKIVRIFNTYGPRMRRQDGRAVPTFIDQALRGEPVTIHGDGSQTRSLCYVDDLIEGIRRVLDSDITGPVNLGNPEEVRILDLARRICELTGGDSEMIFRERPVDDPDVRCPDISLASKELSWKPEVTLDDGLAKTFEWASDAWAV